jgi:hypothetical protein
VKDDDDDDDGGGGGGGGADDDDDVSVNLNDKSIHVTLLMSFFFFQRINCALSLFSQGKHLLDFRNRVVIFHYGAYIIQ